MPIEKEGTEMAIKSLVFRTWHELRNYLFKVLKRLNNLTDKELNELDILGFKNLLEACCWQSGDIAEVLEYLQRWTEENIRFLYEVNYKNIYFHLIKNDMNYIYMTICSDDDLSCSPLCFLVKIQEPTFCYIIRYKNKFHIFGEVNFAFYEWSDNTNSWLSMYLPRIQSLNVAEYNQRLEMYSEIEYSRLANFKDIVSIINWMMNWYQIVIYYQKEYKRLIIELDKQNKLLRKPLEWEAWVNWRDIYYFDFVGNYIVYQINDVHGEIIKYGSNYQIWGHSLGWLLNYLQNDVFFKTATEEEFRQQGIKIIEISEEDINQIYGIMTIESIDKKLEPNTIIKIVSRKNKKG